MLKKNFIADSNYEIKRDSCKDQDNKHKCNNVNKYSEEFTSAKMCEWTESNKCEINNILSPELLLIDEDSIEKVYNDIGHPEIYQKLYDKSK